MDCYSKYTEGGMLRDSSSTNCRRSVSTILASVGTWEHKAKPIMRVLEYYRFSQPRDYL